MSEPYKSIKKLIVNADDFGLSEGVNRGILEAYRNGIVTSTSLMVLRAAATPAIELSNEFPELGLGLHVDLGEWSFEGGSWIPLYERCSLLDSVEVRRELDRQIELFRQMVGKEPTHIDSHQHAHCREDLAKIFVEKADEIGIPLRHFTPSIRYCGQFYGQTTEGNPLHDFVSVENLLEIVKSLPPGITEMACHPAEDTGFESSYKMERVLELKSLCSPLVRATIVENDIQLCNFITADPTSMVQGDT